MIDICKMLNNVNEIHIYMISFGLYLVIQTLTYFLTNKCISSKLEKMKNKNILLIEQKDNLIHENSELKVKNSHVNEKIKQIIENKELSALQYRKRMEEHLSVITRQDEKIVYLENLITNQDKKIMELKNLKQDKKITVSKFEEIMELENLKQVGNNNQNMIAIKTKNDYSNNNPMLSDIIDDKLPEIKTESDNISGKYFIIFGETSGLNRKLKFKNYPRTSLIKFKDKNDKIQVGWFLPTTIKFAVQKTVSKMKLDSKIFFYYL